MSCIVRSFVSHSIISTSYGLMNGEPFIVCALTMWSSSSCCMSSIADRMDIPCDTTDHWVSTVKCLTWHLTPSRPSSQPETITTIWVMLVISSVEYFWTIDCINNNNKTRNNQEKNTLKYWNSAQDRVTIVQKQKHSKHVHRNLNQDQLFTSKNCSYEHAYHTIAVHITAQNSSESLPCYRADIITAKILFKGGAPQPLHKNYNSPSQIH